MPRLSKNERHDLARARLIRVVRNHGIANARTIEQKVADSGPPGMRIDPHVLTPVRKELEEDEVLRCRKCAGTDWFFHRDTPQETIEARLKEQLPLYRALQRGDLRKRLGQTLEIATFRALRQGPFRDYLGRFLDLDDHDDSELYKKEEPPSYLGDRDAGNKKLDFLVSHPCAGWAGIEVKNLREWLYPDRNEVRELLEKCLALDALPVLIARRIHFSTFRLLNSYGVIVHQTYNQRFPVAAQALAEKVKHKDSLGYHDIRVGNSPDPRLLCFINKLPDLLVAQRKKFDQSRQRIENYLDRFRIVR